MAIFPIGLDLLDIIILNNYRGWLSLILKGCVYSGEGIIQGDPFSTIIYAIANIPLIHKLENSSSLTQLVYADDSCMGIGNISHLHSWFNELIEIGPYYSYFAEPKMSYLIVRDE